MPEVALILVDVQREFFQFSTDVGIGSCQKAFCLPGALKLLEFGRKSGWRVVHVGTRHETPTTMPSFLQRKGTPVFCQPGTPGMEFCVDIDRADQRVYKTHYSAFRDTDLQHRLEGISQVVLAGTATDCCVLLTAFDAEAHGFECYAVLQAVSASTRDAFAAGLYAMSKSAADIVDLDALSTGVSLQDSVIAQNKVKERAEAWFNKMAETAAGRLSASPIRFVAD